VSRPELEVTFAAELRMFLAPRHRQGTARYASDGTASLGHIVEALGVPLTEAGSLTISGQLVPPGYRPHDGDQVLVQAVERPQRLGQARFILDVHLGTLARRMRIVGLDTAYPGDIDDADLVERANAGRRVLLTRDRGLLHRRKLRLGGYVRDDRPDEQLRDVLDRYRPPLAPWTRCTSCNGMLRPVAKDEVEPALLPGTRRTYDDFSQCNCCGQVFWRGAHSQHLALIVSQALRSAS
jgi:uncharacterized protein